VVVDILNATRRLGQLLDLIGHRGKALAGFTRTGRFDGCIECQQVGLIGDIGDPSPLSFLPLFNPLDLVQIIVSLVMVGFFSPLPPVESKGAKV
jgi:hypothetical protein